jgi:transmembrane sensor
MTDTNPQAARMSQINDHATHYLERREFGDWDEKDQAELDAWLADSKTNCAVFWRLEAAWDRTHRLAALQPSETNRVMQAHAPFWRRAFKIVAVFAAIAAIGVSGALYALRPQETTYSTTVGGRQVVAFADGSQIELNTDTVLRVRFDDNRRLVRLVHGEAYFDIAHDAKRPLTVIAEGNRIVDLGTRFIVRNDTNKVEVSLLDGRVRFDPADTHARSSSTVLAPGDVVVSTATSVTKAKTNTSKFLESLSWQRGVLVFDNTPLSDAVAELNRYSDRKLVIADEAVGKLEIGGAFPSNNAAAFTRVAKELLGLHIENRGDETVISR